MGIRFSNYRHSYADPMGHHSTNEVVIVNIVQALCFSCRDQAEFTFNGQTLEYDPNQVSKDYIKEYVIMGLPMLSCQLCNRTVQYRQQADGKWKEILIDREVSPDEA